MILNVEKTLEQDIIVRILDQDGNHVIGHVALGNNKLNPPHKGGDFFFMYWIFIGNTKL